MKAKLITYSLVNLPISKQNQFRKEFNGHNDVSHHGRYKYRRDGLLNKIPHLKPSRSTIIVPIKEYAKIINLIKKYKAKVKVFDIQIDKSEFKK